jgi:hypothetical protein
LDVDVQVQSGGIKFKRPGFTLNDVAIELHDPHWSDPMYKLSCRLDYHCWQLLTSRECNNPELVFQAVLVHSEAPRKNLKIDPSKLEPHRALGFFGYFSRELKSFNDGSRNDNSAGHIQRINARRDLPNLRTIRIYGRSR